MAAYATDIGNGITLIDTGLMGDNIVSCYLLQSAQDVAIIETGNYQTCERILDVLETQKIKPEQVKYVIVTHIHLDHAGGASHLIHALPEATLLVHPSGAKHMINPDKLIAASTQVYGEKRFNEMYGTITAIPESRVQMIDDGDRIQVGDETLQFIHTPGHAYHHFCVWYEKDQSWFTGDTFGLCYDAMKLSPQPFLIPTTTPTQFDPEALKHSIHQLLAKRPRRMLLTHFGALELSNHSAIESWLYRQIDDYQSITREEIQSLDNHQQLAEKLFDYCLRLITEQDLSIPENRAREVLAMDLELNAQGLWYWHQKYH